MKNQIILFGLVAGTLLLASCNASQTTLQTKDRTIEVNGIAEKEVTPDEVFFNITLQEYKKNGKKVSLADMEKALTEKAALLGIKKEDLKLENMNAYSYNYYYYGYGYSKRKDDVMATGTYRIKLKDTEQIDQLLEKSEILNVTYAYLGYFSCSQKEKYLDELREKALKITHDKAVKLLAAVGAEIGEVLTITDGGAQSNGNGSYYPYGYYYGGAEERMSNSVDVNTAANQAAVSPRNIKFKAEMKVVYRIK